MGAAGPEGSSQACYVLITLKGGAIPVKQQLFVQWQEDESTSARSDPKSTEMRVYVFSGRPSSRASMRLEPVRAIGGDAEKQWQNAVAEYVIRMRTVKRPPTSTRYTSR
jgi:hypothetical protein